MITFLDLVTASHVRVTYASGTSRVLTMRAYQVCVMLGEADFARVEVVLPSEWSTEVRR